MKAAPLPLVVLALFALPVLALVASAFAPLPPPQAPLRAIDPDEERTAADEVAESRLCAFCHSNAKGATAMRDAEGRSISPHRLWSGTMMAHASRDPLWRAAVSAEVAATPSRKRDIERACLACHAPMAHHAGALDGLDDPMSVLDDPGPAGELARDGVSCTVCHGITPDGLGTDESFSGYHELDGTRLFGPHEKPFAMPMRHHTGFTPTYGPHVLDSAMCGTCHTLETDALDAEGRDLGIRFLEQAPFLEWRASAFARELDDEGRPKRSCQTCHVPERDEDGTPISTRIARNPGGRDFPPTRPREPYGRHRFVGGNTLVLRMLKEHREELGVWASDQVLDETIEATRDQLRNRTARVAIESVVRDGAQLAFEVAVKNLTGHKLPTAHPTRRAWLRVLVRDESGTVLFQSGQVDAQGRIVDGLGRPLPSEAAGGPIEPHRDVVRSSDEVQSYRAVMADAEGQPTHVLLRGVAWHVDDRLLPYGYDRNHPDAARTAPVGVLGDDDFEGGGDRVRYEVRLDAGSPVWIEAELLYQPLSARWAAELFRWDTPEISAFRRMFEAAEETFEILASARAEG